jgi:hypothetical protein
VRTITLDEYFATHKIFPHIIKFDTEGAELLALRGALQTLREYRPVLVVEVAEEYLRSFGHTPKQLVDILRQFKYCFYALERARLKPLDLSESIRDGNLICLPDG